MGTFIEETTKQAQEKTKQSFQSTLRVVICAVSSIAVATLAPEANVPWAFGMIFAGLVVNEIPWMIKSLRDKS